MIKVTYETIGEKMIKPEKTIINIFPGRLWARYNVPNKAKTTVDQMRKDGRTNVLFSRGCLMQTFIGKTEADILEITLQDIKNGLYVAEKKTGKKLKINNLVITK